MEMEYNTFYNDILQSIVVDLDLHHLEVKPAISDPNKPDNNHQLLNVISLKWQNLVNTSKDADIDTCLQSQRIIYIQSLYRQYFLTKHVYNDVEEHNSNEDNPEFIDIFNNALID